VADNAQTIDCWFYCQAVILHKRFGFQMTFSLLINLKICHRRGRNNSVTKWIIKLWTGREESRLEEDSGILGCDAVSLPRRPESSIKSLWKSKISRRPYECALNSLLIVAVLLQRMFVLCSYNFHLLQGLHICRNNTFCWGYAIHKFKNKSDVNNRISFRCCILWAAAFSTED
jgi:hypothetical protein